jgi:SAM-dependent methyltransferase
MRGALQRLLEHPLTNGLDIDAPETTALRRQIITSKPFLRSVYVDWYRAIVRWIPPGNGHVLEIGSGGGFFDQQAPESITSEVFWVPHVGLVADAQSLPINTGSLKAIVMTNVFHHLPNVARFLTEAERCLRPGGRIIMVEPWNTGWSRFVHRAFHNEEMIPDATSWDLPPSGPLSGANAALPWIVMVRDRERLEREWRMKVGLSQPFMPFRYIVSGGVSLRSLQPGWLYPFWCWVDRLKLFRSRFAVFAVIVVDRLD